MKRSLALLIVLCALGITAGSGGEAKSPESLGAHWARVSDEAQIQLVVDELRAVALGRGSERIARKHIAPGVSLSPLLGIDKRLAGTATRKAGVRITGATATADVRPGERLEFEKRNGAWVVVGGRMTVSPNLQEGRHATTVAPAGPSVGETFIATPVSRENDIDRLSRGVTQSRIDRALFSTPDKTASYYHAHYTQTAPYVSATYIQFVTDPSWNRVVYGNMNRWIRAYTVNGPSAIAVDADGRVFVGELGTNRILVLQIVGEGNDAQLQQRYVIPDVANATDIALDDNGTPLNTTDDALFVADASRNVVLKYAIGSTAATLAATFEGFESPTSIQVGKWNGASNGLVYVVDKIAKRIRVFDTIGAELSVVGEHRGTYREYFKAIKVDHFGNVYVVDNVHSRVFKYTAALELLDAQGNDDTFAALGNVDVPFGKIVVDGQGTYWAGFDQMFAIERWSDASGAQRHTLGLGLRDINFHADDDIATIMNTFTLTDFGNVGVRIHDTAGRLVRTMISSWMVSGGKSLVWDRRNDAGEQVPAGTYRYEIGAVSSYRDEPTISRTEFYLPVYYWENSGSTVAADDAHLVQGSAVRWGSEPSQTANEDASAVRYRFTGLDPESEYMVAAEYTANDNVRRQQDMTVNGIRLHDICEVGTNGAVTTIDYVALPKESYAGGEVTISVNRQAEGSAIVSQLWFKETGKGFAPKQLEGSVPTAYALEQNYPNPFNPSTLIRYAVPADGPVTLRVYDIAGREVATLVNDRQTAGTYEVRFSGQNASGRSLASGVYFYQIRSGGFTETRKMLLLK
jgi:hypothetical protein